MGYLESEVYRYFDKHGPLKHLNKQLQLQLSAAVDQLLADERGSQVSEWVPA